ncbi:hypothetical protein E0L01_09225 [Megamonas funiformis]|uniref:hypothetical protein n=1 Tax=Megamonas funiformis TaxID=437897 RepID=UPI0014317E19|nr:hypothetical protein [Megamonas funiformis]NJE28952.1 hypothetical protein [Megamonas funiformis]
MKKIKSMFENLGKNIIVSLMFIVIFLNFNLEDISKVVTGIVAICGLIIAYSYNNGMKNQREQQLLQNKREYYNKFFEAYIEYLTYSGTNNEKIIHSKEFVITLKNFNIELSRLKLYASKEVMIVAECLTKFEEIDKKFDIDNRYNSPILNEEKHKENFLKLFNNDDNIKSFIDDIKDSLLKTREIVELLENDVNCKEEFNELKTRGGNNKDNYYAYYCAILNLMCANILIKFIRKDLLIKDYEELGKVLYAPNLLLIDDDIIYVDREMDEIYHKEKAPK